MSQHLDQTASVLRRAIQAVLGRGLHDPRVRGLISVTRVDVSPDMANATVFVSVIPDEHGELTIHGIRHAARHIRSQVAADVAMRRVPRLTFKLDESLKREAKTIAAINEAVAESADRESSRTDEEPES